MPILWKQGQMERGLISSHLLCCTGNCIVFFRVNSVQVRIPLIPRGSFKRRSGVSDIRLMFLTQLLLLRRSPYLRRSLLCYWKKKKKKLSIPPLCKSQNYWACFPAPITSHTHISFGLEVPLIVNRSLSRWLKCAETQRQVFDLHSHGNMAVFNKSFI